jgi:hypothetical protein
LTALERTHVVAKITTQDVLDVLKPLWTTIPETASRLRGPIELVLNHARAAHYIPADAPNPARWHGHLELLLGDRKRLTRSHHGAMAYVDAPGSMQAYQRRRWRSPS